MKQPRKDDAREVRTPISPARSASSSISRLEALRITTTILEEAERERLEIAEWEASRGIYWEERG